MIGLDTNVLVRYLTYDEPHQAAKAAREIETATERGEHMFLANIVLCELVWVLEDAYGYKRKDLIAILEKILRTSQFAFEDKDVIWRALRDFQTSKGDFSDYLIGRTNQKGGCSQTLTFDRELKNDDIFRVF
ncbi:MAG: type II toxin-antitoxin system VapC family toxin [Deltaproteobacteria bacterium]|nr:type II toxin-antitoxin system VapC family toxin [Deltaproteobacteria bacterium]